jgi:hypothetical protein
LVAAISQSSGCGIDYCIFSQTLYGIGHIARRAQEFDQYPVSIQLCQSIDRSDPNLIEPAWLAIEQ